MARLFSFAVVFLLVTIQSTIAQENPAEIAIQRDSSVKWIANGYRKMDQELADRDLSKIDVVFIGDSITRQWTREGQGLKYWNQSFPNGLNLAMGGDRTEHVLFRLTSKEDGGKGNLDDQRLQPKTIVLMIGTNSLFSRTLSKSPLASKQ